ncbi:MAG: hypothetical protein U5K30_14390 [Acidimicrobiales bacterium]|nr:hypothetical protein [Acidimicrobiales bacterium]
MTSQKGLHGIDRVPQVQAVAAAIQSIAPVVAGVLSSDDEPTVARDRAFLRAATLAQRLSPSEQALLMDALLDQTTAPRMVGSPIPAQLSPAPVLASVG